MKLTSLTLDEHAKHQLIEAFFSIIVAFLVTGVVLAALGYNPFQVYSVLFQGALNGPARIGYTLGQLVPLIFTGLCAVVAFKGGMWNIGGEGQLFIGAAVAEVVGLMSIFPGVHLFVTIVLGVLAAGLWAGLAGFLKAYFKVDELVSTIMLNFIAMAIVLYLVLGPIRDESQFFMIIGLPIQQSAHFPQLFGSEIRTDIIEALIVIGAMYFLMQRTTFGFETRILESNPLAADYSGVKTKKNQVLIMFLSGCMAGFAGVSLVCSNLLPFGNDISPSFGYVGISIAFLASLNILLVIPAAALFAILYSGGNVVMSEFGIPTQTVAMASALVILAFLASGPLIARLRRIVSS